MAHIVWDRDGCLVDSGRVIFESYKRIADRFDLDCDDFLSSYANFRLWNRTNWLDNYRIMGLPEDKWKIADTLFEENTKYADTPFFEGVQNL